MATLLRSFYRRGTVAVAKALLGKRLVRVWKGERLAGRIVEVEAYLGARDAAAHTYGGRRTERNEAMYLDGGHAYVYFVYGMHHCMNVVTRRKDMGEAVLIRALEPEEGLERMRRFRRRLAAHELANGPAKLCAALQIGRSLNAADLCGRTLFLEDAPRRKGEKAAAGPRIGVEYAGEAARWPLRFFVKGNPCVSRGAAKPLGRAWRTKGRRIRAHPSCSI